MNRTRRHLVLAGAVALILTAGSTLGQTTAALRATGAVTNLPLPRFVSLKASEANIRRGPSMSHRIDWVFRHPGMPLIVTGEYGHWRRVVDRDGAGGWVHYALLSGNRTVIIDAETAELRTRAAPDAPVEARAERGVIARLGDCQQGWCRVTAGGHRGWLPAVDLWGLDSNLPE